MASSAFTYFPQPSVSCASKGFEGLRVQSPNCYWSGKPNLNVEFHRRVYKSIQQPGCGKATRARFTMMPMGTPRVVHKGQLVDLWNALYRDRIVFIGQHIDDEFSNKILATLLYLDTIEDFKRLYLFICCLGGDLNPTMSIYDTVQSLRTPIGTHCIGGAINMACFLLAAGEKGMRSAMPFSMIALQSPGGAARGQADDICNEADELLRVRDYLFKELAQQTGQPVDKIHKDLRGHVKWFTSEEAVEYGIIDRIIRPKPIRADEPLEDSIAGLG